MSDRHGNAVTILTEPKTWRTRDDLTSRSSSCVSLLLGKHTALISFCAVPKKKERDGFDMIYKDSNVWSPFIEGLSL